jgi:hypothetical protein
VTDVATAAPGESALPASAPSRPAPVPPSRWIIGPREDLVWFQGSVLAGLALLGLFLLVPPLTDASYAVASPAVLLVFLWGALFDGTHVWGTYARTWFAPPGDAASREGLPGAWALGLLLAGPALAVVDHLACPQGPSPLGTGGWLFRHFLLAAYLWAYWHLVRQHYGFLTLYRRKAGETSRAGLRLDGAILWVGSLYPYVRFSLSPAYAAGGLPVVVPAEWAPALITALDAGVAGLGLLLVALMVSGKVEPFRPGPKHLLLAIVVGFHLLVFATLDHLLTITAALTIFHNLQYHRIVWQYERGKGRAPSGGLVPYLALGGLLGLVWYGPRILGVAATDSSLLRNALLGLGWGVAFHHYLVDGRIWRVRRSASLGTTLDAGARA